MSVTIRGRLPKGDTNGIADLEPNLAEDPDTTILVIGRIQTDTIEDRPHDADNPRAVKVVFVHLEAIHQISDAKAADEMMRHAYTERTGKTELGLDDETEEE